MSRPEACRGLGGKGVKGDAQTDSTAEPLGGSSRPERERRGGKRRVGQRRPDCIVGQPILGLRDDMRSLCRCFKNAVLVSVIPKKCRLWEGKTQA